MNPRNAAELMDCRDIDGGLIGVLHLKLKISYKFVRLVNDVFSIYFDYSYVLALSLIVLILMQHGKGADAGAALVRVFLVRFLVYEVQIHFFIS